MKIAIKILLIITLSTLLMGCNSKDDYPIKTKIEVYHPVTGELIKENEIVNLNIEEVPDNFEVKVKASKQYLHFTDYDIRLYVDSIEVDTLPNEVGKYKLVWEFNSGKNMNQKYTLSSIRIYLNIEE
jgi:hypothetical protein